METKRKQEQQYSYQIKQANIKAMKRDKEGRYIMIKGSIHEEDITIINTYASNIGAPQYVRQMLKDLVQTGNRKGVETQTQNNKVNGNGIILINNYLKCKWVECRNQKTKTG